MDNPDHLKYMPPVQSPEEDPTLREETVIQEDTTEEETVLEEEPEKTGNSPGEPENAGSRDAEKVTAGQRILQTTVIILKSFLEFFYDLFNPLLIPAYCTLITFDLSILSTIVPHACVAIVGVVFIATCVIPALSICAMYLVRAIRTPALETRKDRIFPYIISIAGFVCVALLFKHQHLPGWLGAIYLAAAVTALLNFIVNFKVKVSNHCSAMAAAVAAYFVINQDGMPHTGLGWWVIGTVIAAGVTGSCAIALGRHNLKEVLAGYATGLLPMCLLLAFFY